MSNDFFFTPQDQNCHEYFSLVNHLHRIENVGWG